MKKTVLFALPLAALFCAVACKKQEAAAPAPAANEQVAGTATEAAPAAAQTATSAPAPAADATTEAKPAEKKGK